MKRIVRRVVVAIFCCVAVPAGAHDRTVSYSSWDIEGAHARVTASLTPLDVSRFPWAADAGPDFDRRLGGYLIEHLELVADGQPCRVTAPPTRVASADEQRVTFGWEVACPSTRRQQVRSTLLLDVAPTHLHFARVHQSGQPTLERVLSDAERTWSIGDTGTGSGGVDTLLDALWLGFARACTGGALAFVVALLLGGGDARHVARVVIGFAATTSIALGVSVLGGFRFERAPVNALIGLSIALAAGENLWLAAGRRPVVGWLAVAALAALSVGARGGPLCTAFVGATIFVACYLGLGARLPDPAPLRAPLACLFGLACGFGLAATLCDAAPPADRLAPMLLAFNIGVGASLLAALAVPPLLQAASEIRGVVGRAVVDYGSAMLLALGVFWLVSRGSG